MRWNLESIESRAARLSRWHKWFAWFPVRIGEQIVWLESVERKKVWDESLGYDEYPGGSYLVEYRNITTQ